MTSTIQSIPVDPTPPASGEGLIFNGTVYVPTPANPGDITAVNTTLPLTGGGVSGALTLDINNFTGDSGLGGLDGAVPAPAAGDAAAGKFLAAGGGWSAPTAGLVKLGSASESSQESTGTGALASPTLNIVLTKPTLLLMFDTSVKFASSGGGLPVEFMIQLRVDGVVKAGRVVRGVDGVANWSIAPVSMHVPVTGLALGAHTIDVYVTLAGTIVIYSDAVAPTILSAWEV